MTNSLNLGYPDIPKSITNPNVNNKNAIDVGYPMSFLDFIKNINISLEPDSLQNYYNFYIKKWNNLSKLSNDSNNAIIIERYKNFLKDIIINYSTLEEKRFLSKINFDDPFDMDIILGFYSKKLREICNFYNKKRHTVKNSVVTTKLKGSNFGTNITIKDLVISHIKTLDDYQMFFNMDDVISKLEIEIEELYDTYPLYYNQPPNEQIYDLKDLDYGLNIFLANDKQLISEVFKDVSSEIKNLKEADELFDNKRKLTEKYISTDFYFLSTGSTVYETTSGKLFDSENTILNFLNRTYPTTASTDRHQYQSPRERGFFRPINVSLVLLDGKNGDYYVNYDNLEPNSIYFYPDPKIFGDINNVIKFTIDDSFLKNNTSTGNASNQPSSHPTDTKYYGYSSKIESTDSKYFDNLFNSGYIKEYKQDIYGNSYALLKKGFDKYVTNLDISNITTYNIIFNGYKFYDDMYDEGFFFDYYTSDDSTFDETIRTGLSSNTSNFSVFNPDITLKFGSFKNNFELISPTEDNLVKTYRYIDGAILTRHDLSLIPDPISSDLSAFEFSSSNFYYNKLIESGIHNSTQRALLDSTYPTLTANFVNYNRPSTTIVDGGRFEDVFNYFESTINSIYIDDNINNTELLPLSTFDRFDGMLLIKNHNTNTINDITSTLPYFNVKYPTNLFNQLNNIIKFEVAFDTLIIETENYILFEKIIYENNQFLNSNNPTYYNTHNNNNFKKITNRIKVNNNIFYTILESVSSLSSLRIVPNIYKYDLLGNTHIKLFPLPSDNISLHYFDILQNNVNYVNITSPIINYSSRNNIFTLSFILKDQNNYPMITTYDINISSHVEFISKNYIIFSNEIISNIFSSIPSNIILYLDNNYTIYDDTLII